MLFSCLQAKCRESRGELQDSESHQMNGVWVPEYSKEHGTGYGAGHPHPKLPKWDCGLSKKQPVTGAVGAVCYSS